MPDLGWQELAIILVIVVVIFGAGRLPEIGGALGKSIKEFKANSEGILDKKPKETALTTSSGKSDQIVSKATNQLRADEI